MSRRVILAFVLSALLSGALPFATSARFDARSDVQSLPGTKVTVRAGHTLRTPKPIQAPLPARALDGQPLAPTANIEVAYTGFSPEAQAAFDAAAAVWESLIVSPCDINVTASWTPLGEGILGSAGPTGLYKMSSDDRWYPTALYETTHGCDVAATEIDADFNSAFGDWYLGTDGNVPFDKYDFFSVVLHELGHGLGFFSSFEVGGSSGKWGYPSGGVTYPLGFDLNEWDASTGGSLITSAYANDSAALEAQLTDGSVFFGGANVMAALGGSRAQLYAPSTWEDGSSNSHFDEAAFPAGNQNALMTPYLDNGEVNHDPGPLTLAVLRDIGWSLTGGATAPGPPTGVTATPGDAQALINWTAPSSDGGSPVTGYTVTAAPDGNTCAATSVPNCTVSGLVNGTSYTFTVTATNAAGTGPPSDPSNSVTPQALAGPTIPGAPSGVMASPGDGQVLVSWSAPASDGGSPITGYTATSNPEGRTCTTPDGSTTSCMVSGLTNGQPHTFTVIATNASGDGPASSPSAAATPVAPPPGSLSPDGRIRKGTGAFVGNNVYNTTGLNQTKTGAKLRGYTIKFGISIQNDATATDSFGLTVSGLASAKYTLTYWHGTTDITAAVVAGTFTTPSLAPGAKYLVTVKVKVASSATKGSSTTRLVTITSVGDPTKQDAVSFTGKRK